MTGTKGTALDSQMFGAKFKLKDKKKGFGVMHFPIDRRAPTPVSTKNLNKLASWMHPVAEDDDDDDAIKPTGSPTQAPTKMVVPTHKPTVNPLAIDDDNSFDFAVHN